MQLAFVTVAALTAAVLASPVSAQTPPDAPDTPMSGFNSYSHPDIGQDACKVVNPGYAECVIPAKSAGRYLVVAAGTSTATGDGATQTLAIGGRNWLCGNGKATDTAKWSSGAARTFHVACLIDVLTDAPLTVGVAYQDANATKDPKGPTLTIKRVPWNGILSSVYAGAQ